MFKLGFKWLYISMLPALAGTMRLAIWEAHGLQGGPSFGAVAALVFLASLADFFPEA
jgi:hypothetical protein